MLQEAGDEEGLKDASKKLREYKDKYRNYSKEHGLGMHNDRTQVYGYDRSKSMKTVWAGQTKGSGNGGSAADNLLTGGALAPIIQAVVAPETKGQNKTGGGSIFSIPKEIMVRLTDVNGKYIAQGVNEVNLQEATVSGA